MFDEDSNKKYFLEIDVEYPKVLLNLHGGVPFLPKRNKITIINKPVCNTRDKEKYVADIMDLKQALNHTLILNTIHKVIQFNQEAWLKPNIDMNTELRKEGKRILKRISLN